MIAYNTSYERGGDNVVNVGFRFLVYPYLLPGALLHSPSLEEDKSGRERSLTLQDTLLSSYRCRAYLPYPPLEDLPTPGFLKREH